MSLADDELPDSIHFLFIGTSLLARQKTCLFIGTCQTKYMFVHRKLACSAAPSTYCVLVSTEMSACGEYVFGIGICL